MRRTESRRPSRRSLPSLRRLFRGEDEDPAAASVAPGAGPSESDAGPHEAVGVPEWDEPYVAPTWSRDDDPFGAPASSEQYEPFAELPNHQHSDSLQESQAEAVDATSGDQVPAPDAPSTTWDRSPAASVPVDDPWESEWSSGSAAGAEEADAGDVETDVVEP